ncbi:NUDIX hydrolase [Nocardioides lianchengensis]|uniref:ADP-ribose pyrophosphatase YjhB, NUDIX family n=1 Tax=Nocardioides lianchengensis TaxID=1045774 RepID=A0A1G6RR17_9ACTN|nr:NUDIX domain-containing protein [Nocardioides lianchengensis]NYG10148.1 8-oxo-dGTP pyrophosphatase MutT (NUDIX family) [Nocardioides lianchengensis]SDD06988.1 ADP-ribose pyrophosphatase YjhB, NUDIX family [Nocardioides lianchengensis]
MTDPVRRVAARVLPVSATGEVLLLQCQDPARPGDLHWISVGGAVDAGESLQEAALRELVEETGVVVTADLLSSPLHRGEYPFTWDGVDYLSDTTLFALPLDRGTEVSFARLEEAEVGNVLAAGWWTPDALRADGSAASPDLPDIMEAAIAAVRGDT